MKEMDEASDMLREEIAQVHDESKNYMASQVTRLTNPDHSPTHPIVQGVDNEADLLEESKSALAAIQAAAAEEAKEENGA